MRQTKLGCVHAVFLGGEILNKKLKAELENKKFHHNNKYPEMITQEDMK